MNKKITSSLAGAFLFIIIINLMSRGLGFFREVLFANYFGLGKDFDTYLVAAVLPITINTVIQFLGQNYFIPHYSSLKQSDSNSAEGFYKSALIAFLLLGIIISAVLYFASDLFTQFFLRSQDENILDKVTVIFRIFLITIPLNSVLAILIAHQQAEYRFKHPALSRLFLNLAVIAVLILFTDKIGIYTIPIGFVIGTFLQLIYMIYKSRVYVGGSTISFIKNANVFSVFDLSLLSIIAIELIYQMYTVSDRYFFSELNVGGISALNYSMTVYLLPVSTLSIALATVIFPKLTECLQSGRFDELQERFENTMRASLFIFVPITFILIFYSDQIIRLFFERGKFDADSTAATAQVLKIYAISLIFYSTYAVLNKLVYSAKLTKELLFITLLGIIIKVGLNYLLVKQYHQNGLALATSIGFIFFFIGAAVLLFRKTPLKNPLFMAKEILFYLVNAGISIAVIEVVFDLFMIDVILSAILKIILFPSLFLINIYLIKHESTKILTNLISTVKDSFSSA